MIEGRDGMGLAIEAAEAVGVVRRGVRQHLERDLPPQPRIPGAVELPHSAAGQRSDDLVGSHQFAGFQRHPR